MKPTKPAKLTLPRGAKVFHLLGSFARVYLVDGGAVRSKCVSWVGGGHHACDRFIPKDEIWIEKGFREDGGYILAHEMIEKLLMDNKGWGYEKAHDAANDMEADLRLVGISLANEGKLATVIGKHLQRHFPHGHTDRQHALAASMAGTIRRF